MGEVIESSNDSKNEIPDKLNNSYNLRKNKFNTMHDTTTGDPEEPASKKIKIEGDIKIELDQLDKMIQ